MKNKKILVCNWKSNPKTEHEAQELAQFMLSVVPADASVLIAPSMAHLPAIRSVLEQGDSSIGLASQDISPYPDASVTGCVSGYELHDMGVTYVIVGHSERRRILKEDDALVQTKTIAAVEGGLVPIICVGEEDRTDVSQAISVCLDQLSLDIGGIVGKKFMVAYEPVWAIGGSADIEPKRAAEVIDGIKSYVEREYKAGEVPVLYGGSVRCENIESLVYFTQIDGFLVGSASLHEGAISCIINNIFGK